MLQFGVFSSFVCMHVCVSVFVCARVCLGVSVHICGGLKLVLSVFLNCSSPFCSERDLSLNLELTDC